MGIYGLKASDSGYGPVASCCGPRVPNKKRGVSWL